MMTYLLLLLLFSPKVSAFGGINQPGSQDGGGGHFRLSTPKEVRDTLNHALTVAAQPNPKYNIFVDFFLTVSQERFGRRIESPNPAPARERLFPHLTGTFYRLKKGRPANSKKNSDYEWDYSKTDSPLRHALLDNVIEIKEKGDCGRARDHHADGSVSALNWNAKLCFSLEHLTKIPHEALLPQLLGLILHEGAHMGGALEPEAVAWQNWFLNYYEHRMGSAKRTFELYQSTAVRYGKIFETALDIEKYSPNDPRATAYVARGLQALLSLPHITDPLFFYVVFGRDPAETNRRMNLTYAVIEDAMYASGTNALYTDMESVTQGKSATDTPILANREERLWSLNKLISDKNILVNEYPELSPFINRENVPFEDLDWMSFDPLVVYPTGVPTIGFPTLERTCILPSDTFDPESVIPSDVYWPTIQRRCDWQENETFVPFD